MHRFFLPRSAFSGEQVVLPEAPARQVRSVLRLRTGDQLVVLDNEGWEYVVSLVEVNRQRVRGHILARQAAPGDPTVSITLYQSLLPRDKFEWVLQKGTEVGVASFVPVVTQRSLVQATELKPNKEARWHKIVAEAAEQCRRGRIPELHPPLTLADALSQLAAFDLVLMPWEGAKEQGIRPFLDRPKPAAVALFIGPEGGFDAAEVALAQQHGVQPVTLGPRILRAETAAVVAAALLLHELGELA